MVYSTDGKAQIRESSIADGTTFVIFYTPNEDAGICAIAIKGQGIFYREEEYLDVCDTEDYKDDDGTKSMSKFLEFSQTLSSVQSIVSQASSNAAGALSAIPYEDPKFDTLYDTFDDQYWDGDENNRDVGTKGLEALTYAVDHLADQYEYQELAHEITSSLIERYSTVNRDIAIQSMLLWKKCNKSCARMVYLFHNMNIGKDGWILSSMIRATLSKKLKWQHYRIYIHLKMQSL